jgi:hypothetical protein
LVPRYLGARYDADFSGIAVTTSELLLVLVGLAMYANPILLLLVWVRRLKAPHQKASVRIQLGWFSLILASAGFLVFVGSMFFGPPAATPAFDIWFRTWLKVSLFISAPAFLTGLAGKGTMQWVVAASAIVTPMSLILQKVLE